VIITWYRAIAVDAHGRLVSHLLLMLLLLRHQIDSEA
jgi:hypothetical protein